MDRTESEFVHSHLFIVRLWVEKVDDDDTEIRGSVQHVLSQDYLIFRTWQDLHGFLEAVMEFHGSNLDSGEQA